MNLEDFKKINSYRKAIFFDDLSFLKNINNEDAYIINIDKIPNHDVIKDLKKIDNIFLFSWGNFRRSYLTTLADLKAYKNIDKFFENFKCHNKIIITLFNNIYDSNLFEIALKKMLIIQLRNYYEIEIIKKIINLLCKKKVEQNLNNKQNIYIKNFLENKNTSFFERSSIDYKTIFKFLCFPFYFSINQKITIFNKKKYFKNFFRIYENGIGVGKLGNLDWLIKYEDIKKDDNVFVFEDLPANKSRHKMAIDENNYEYVNCSNRQLNKITIKKFLKNIIIYSPIGFFISIYLGIFRPNHLLFFYEAWSSFFKWSNFLNFYTGKNYIVYHNYQISHIFRNILLKKARFNLIHYKHTSSENIFCYNTKDKYNNADQAYLFYDIEFHQTKQSIEMSIQNKSLTKKKIIYGPTLILKKINTIIQKKQLVFFNSSFTDGHAANPVLAHKNLLKFINEISFKNDYQIIFKSKKKIDLYRNYNNEFYKLVNNLTENKKIKIIDYAVNLQDIILESDLSIHMPFASTSIISLFNKKKFFFYDSLNYYKNSYYSKFTDIKFVSKTVNENFRLIEFYLKMKQLDYEKYISECFLETFELPNNKKKVSIKEYL